MLWKSPVFSEMSENLNCEVWETKRKATFFWYGTSENNKSHSKDREAEAHKDND